MARKLRDINQELTFKVEWLFEHCMENKYVDYMQKEPLSYAMFTYLPKQERRWHIVFEVRTEFHFKILPLNAARCYTHWLVLNLYRLAIYFDP